MEMESSRRPFDRSREPGLKKPRLTEETVPAPPNGRTFSQRQVVPGSASRFRASERDRDSEGSDSLRGPYQQQPTQHQELVSQYKKALAELTFNSKPIITNLTIIAGENSHAAKAIAAVICTNILEVPREQKLPSLYLLDSIVKNIGRDYIRYFAARLPEVFCKAYRQVDPSIHSGMRHLFGTWKGVFPPQSLQAIEKELGFGNAANGSSAGSTTARPDSQAQRPAPSIHVNPKYLERQRLQQSTRAKETVGSISGTLSDSSEDPDRLDRIPSVSSGRPWVDSSAKNIQRVHREQLSEPERDRNIILAYGDSDYSYDVLKRSGLGAGRVSEKLKDQGLNRPWYDSNQRNGIDLKHGHQGYLAQKPLETVVPPRADIANRNSSELSKSWKNSEEEEYMWDDISSRSTDYLDSSAKDRWTSDDFERLDFEINPQKALGRRTESETSAESLPVDRKGQTAFGRRMSPSWSQEPHLSEGTRLTGSDGNILGHSEGYSTSSVGLSGRSYPVGRNSLSGKIGPVNMKNPGFGSSIDNASGPTEAMGKQGHAIGASSPLHRKIMNQLPPSLCASNPVVQTSAKQGQTHTMQRGDPRKHLLSGKLGADSRSSVLAGKAVLPQIPGSRKSGTLDSNSNMSNLSEASTQTPMHHASSPPRNAPGSFPSPPSQLDTSLSTTSQGKVDQQPLPLGLPSSSITTEAITYPMSSLIDSLVERGLITASKSNSAAVQAQILSGPKKSSSAVASTDSAMNSSLQVSTSTPTSSVETVREVSGALPQTNATEIKSLIGFEFKPKIIRELHPEVISDLLDDLPHCCSSCGIRFRLKECLDKHLEWHALKGSEHNESNKPSRQWYTDSVHWVQGTGSLSGVETVGSPEVPDTRPEHDEPMVPADESQCVCILCGELFEDFFSQERDRWMFKGTVYLSGSLHDGNTNELLSEGVIVHATCSAETSLREVNRVEDVKLQ